MSATDFRRIDANGRLIKSFIGNFGEDLAFGTNDDDTIRSAQRGDSLFGEEEEPLFA